MNTYKSIEMINSSEKITLQKYFCDSYQAKHTHDFIEIQYVFKGCGSQTINDKVYQAQKGDLFFFNFRDNHSFEPTTEMGIFNFLFNPEFFSDELVNSDNALDILTLTSFHDFDSTVPDVLSKISFHGSEQAEIENLLELMFSEFKSKDCGYKTLLKSYSSVLLVKIFRAIKSVDTLNLYTNIQKITPDVLEYIEENYNKKLSLAELAKISFYNPSYFCTVFHECYGKTVVEYINDKRIACAISLICDTTDTIEAIRYQVGFNDKKQFFKLFKKQTGMTPETYRMKIQK